MHIFLLTFYFIIKDECEFETPKICGYTQDLGDVFDWTRGSGETASYYTGPKTDHTYGTAKGMLSVVKRSLTFLFAGQVE